MRKLVVIITALILSSTSLMANENPVKKEIRTNIVKLLKKAKFKLSEKEEQLVNLKDLTGCNAFQKLYGELTASFEFEMEVDGEIKQMNGSELRALRLHKDPKVREQAMKLFFSANRNLYKFSTL